MVMKVPSFIGKSKRQSATYETPYAPRVVPKLRGFFDPRNNKPAPCVCVYTQPTHAEVGVVHEQEHDHSSSKFNARMARYTKR